jgi:hypothetical protein
MDTVYVVMGQRGEYSDHESWPVKAFSDKKTATDFEFDLTRRAHTFDKVNTAGLVSVEFRALNDELRATRDKCGHYPPGAFDKVGAAREKIMADAHAAAGLKELDPQFNGTPGTDYYTLEVPFAG